MEIIIGHYSDFQVQTIDSFTSRLAQASARELGFRPDFETTFDNGELIDYALAMLAKEVGQARELKDVMDEFLSQMNASGETFIWEPQKKMRETFAVFLKIEAKETGKFVFSDQRGNLQRGLSDLQQIYDQTLKFVNDQKLPVKPRGNLLEAIESKDYGRIVGWKCFNPDNGLVALSEVKKTDKRRGLAEESMRIWGRTEPVVAGLAQAYAMAAYAAFHLPYGHFKKHLELAKKRQGIHHLDDIARSLSEYLGQSQIPEVYLKLGARIHHYLLDEFQDTDPAQWRCLTPLIHEALASDGSCYLVGDLKQAIYMFRQADYRIMRDIKEDLGRPGTGGWVPPSVAHNAETVSLWENYRCGQAIVDYVDQVFKVNLPHLIEQGVFGPDLTGLTSYEQKPSQENLGRGYVEVRHFPQPVDEGGGGEDEQDLGQDEEPVKVAVLEIIRDAKDRDYSLHDIAVLANSNWELDQAIDWLTEAGIPATSSSGLDIRKRRAVAEVITLLRWLALPIDNLAWAGVLGGELLGRAAQADGLSWDTAMVSSVFLSAGPGKGGYLYQHCRRQPSFGPLWEKYFQDLYRLAGFWPVYDLTCLALERFGVLKHFPDEAASLVKFLEVIKRKETEGVSTMARFLQDCDTGDDDLFGLELSGSMPAVQLMTYYKAKGMGFPVVINLFRQSRGKGAEYYHRRVGDEITMYKINKVFAPRTRGCDPDLEALQTEMDRDVEIQMLNSLYVACTRAENELYNLVSYKPNIAKPQKHQAGTKKAKPNDGETPPKEPPQPSYSLLFPACPPLGTKGRGKGGEPAYNPLDASTSCSASAPEWRKQPGWSVTRFDEARVGKYIHRVLEAIEYLPDDKGPMVRELLEKHRLMDPGANVEKLARELTAFLNHPKISPWFSTRSGRMVYREVDFLDREGRVYMVDRLVRDDGGITVLDFKTGAESPANSLGHREKMKEYLQVTGEAFPGQPVTGLVCYWDGQVAEVRL